MHSVLHETVQLNSGLNRLNDQNHLSDCFKIRENIFSMIISIYQSGMTSKKSLKMNHMYGALLYLDRIEFDLKSIDIPECWNDFDNIIRDIKDLRGEINSYLLDI